jgi:hypothetical protein
MGESRDMSFRTANPMAFAVFAGTVVYLMAVAGVATKRLTVRGKLCPTCHRPRSRCTCRWL